MKAETASERYAREAKARLAARIGEDLAEEFTTVAKNTDRDVVNTAELMAAAYLMGRQAARHGVEGSGGEALPVLCALQFRVPGRKAGHEWVNGTAWMEERHMSCTVAELLERYQRTAEGREEWRAVTAQPTVVPAVASESAGQPREPLSQPLSQAEPEPLVQQAAPPGAGHVAYHVRSQELGYHS